MFSKKSPHEMPNGKLSLCSYIEFNGATATPERLIRRHSLVRIQSRHILRCRLQTASFILKVYIMRKKIVNNFVKVKVLGSTHHCCCSRPIDTTRKQDKLHIAFHADIQSDFSPTSPS
jgi:hypothetical protein